MGFRCGIVGLPNVGKSTLFNALTQSGVQAENYPFCTIDPNVGMVEVPDPRLRAIAEIVQPKKIIPTTIEFVDIAGLVAGASRGEGLGNQFLAHIREVDAIAHVVRAFENNNIIHVADRVDPLADLETINTELTLADMETVQKARVRAEKASRSGDKEALRRLELFARTAVHLDGGGLVRQLPLSDEEQRFLKTLCLLTAKPAVYLVNVAEDGFEDNPLLDTVKNGLSESAVVVPICAAIEAELCILEDAEKIDFLQEMGLEEPGLNRVIRAGYALLELLTFFTAGPKEVRAWTVRGGADAAQAAGVIHSDFERGFIRAETIAYTDFIDCQGEQGAREAGKLRLEGKDYIVQDGDLLHFRFNV